MLSLCGDRPNIVQLLREDGAFAWWYLDLVDGEGQGLVLIWSFGLPFLPDARTPRPARDRPSLSLSLYRDGVPWLYALQTHRPEAASCSPDGRFVRLGRSTFELRPRGGRVEVLADLDLDLVGGERLRGRLHAEGHAVRLPSVTAPSSSHAWAPILAASSAVADLDTPEGPVRIAGRVYVDGNHSERPLHELGIADWRCGRVAFAERELVYYLVEPESSDDPPIALVLEIDEDGRARHHDQTRVVWHGPRRSIYGLRYHDRLTLDGPDLALSLRVTALVDDGPFYLRFLVEGEDHRRGELGRGVAERVVPSRVDRPWQRPFVRMRTQAVGGDNSIWLPLFSGRRRGRFRRLFGERFAPAGREVRA